MRMQIPEPYFKSLEVVTGGSGCSKTSLSESYGHIKFENHYSRKKRKGEKMFLHKCSENALWYKMKPSEVRN